MTIYYLSTYRRKVVKFPVRLAQRQNAAVANAKLAAGIEPKQRLERVISGSERFSAKLIDSQIDASERFSSKLTQG